MTWHQESIVPDFGLTLESEVSLVNRPNLLFGGLSDRDAILCHEFMFCGRDALSLATQFHLTVEEVQQQVTHFVGRIDSLGHWCE